MNILTIVALRMCYHIQCIVGKHKSLAKRTKKMVLKYEEKTKTFQTRVVLQYIYLGLLLLSIVVAISSYLFFDGVPRHHNEKSPNLIGAWFPSAMRFFLWLSILLIYWHDFFGFPDRRDWSFCHRFVVIIPWSLFWNAVWWYGLRHYEMK